MSDRPDANDSAAAAIFEDLLGRLAFRARVIYRGQLCGGWTLDTSGSGKASFHVVLHGDCWLHLAAAAEPAPLQAGDVVVFPRDQAHIISGQRELPPVTQEQSAREVPLDRAREGTALLCGYLDVDAGAHRLVLAALPEYLVVRGDRKEGERIRRLLDLLFDEAQRNELGSASILDRLADALLLYVIRYSMNQNRGRPGIFAALADNHLRHAVLAIHTAPHENWTLDALAAKAFMSRSAFAERFAALVGMPPMEYLLEWRMFLAQRWLTVDRLSVPAVAERCGYRSEAAFRKAFKRVVGVGPGAWRR